MSGRAHAESRRVESAIEPLEARTLMALTSWTGLGGDLLWSNPANWSANVVPGVDDDVRIDAGAANPVISFTSEAGGRRVRSLELRESLSVTGGQLTVTAGARMWASVSLAGGALAGPSWEFASGTGMTVSGSRTSRLVGPTLFTGSLSVVSSTLRVAGDFDLAGTATVSSGAIDFVSDITLDTGTFTLVNGRLGLAAEGATARTMTIGPGATVRGRGNVGNALFSEGLTTTLVNRGAIIADASTQFLAIAPVGAFPSTFDNQGLVRATGGGIARVAAAAIANYSDASFGTLTGGTWRADASSSLILDNSRPVAINNADVLLTGAGATFANMTEQLRVNNGSIMLGTGMQWTRYFGVSNNGLITLEASTSLSFPVQGTHTGRFVLGPMCNFSTTGFSAYLPGTTFSGTGTLQLTTGSLQLRQMFAAGSAVTLNIGRNATVTLTEPVTLGAIDLSGQLSTGVHRLTLSGAYVQRAGSTVSVDVASAQQVGAIHATGAVTMAGTLRALSSTGFDPSLQGASLFTAAILRGSSLAGDFASVSIVSSVRGAIALVNTGVALELRHNIADYNADGGVDGADLELFLVEWERGEMTTDVNGDGGVDGLDIESFLTLWMQGGR
ncbi:MAG: GC-type dockerin domain-anchored protein [Phycisphaerae bacterium]